MEVSQQCAKRQDLFNISSKCRKPSEAESVITKVKDCTKSLQAVQTSTVGLPNGIKVISNKNDSEIY